MSDEKTFVQKRKWLNPIGHDDTGAMSWGVSADGYDCNGWMTIRDCGRQIDLSFSVCNEKDLKARLKKLDIFQEAIDDLRENLEKGLEHYKEEKEKRQK